MEMAARISGGEPGPVLVVGGHVLAWVTADRAPGAIVGSESGRWGVVKRNWVQYGYPQGWAALRPSTMRDKVRRGFFPMADQTRTGKLLRDAQHPGMVVMDEGGLYLLIPPSQNNYAGFHQGGTVRGRAAQRKLGELADIVQLSQGMPARPVYQIGQDDLGAEAAALAAAILIEAGFA